MEWADHSSGNKFPASFFNVRIILYLILPILIWNIDYHSTNEHFTLCLFKNITGRDCYGCGVLRGLSAALHLDLSAAIRLNRLNILTLPLLLAIYMKELWKIRPDPVKVYRSFRRR